MKVVEMEQATDSLSNYARKHRREAVLVVRGGKPLSALLPLNSRADLERVSLSVNPRFKAILERGRSQVRAGKVISAEGMRQLFGLTRKAR